MRVAAAAQLVYLNPPRTATTTIDRQLKANGLELWRPPLYSGHQTLWKPEWEDYFVFMSVRSPWTRAISLWRRTVEYLQYRNPRQRKALQDGKISFEGMLFCDCYWDWWSDVAAHRFAEGVPHIDLIVHQETLREDFGKIPRVNWVIDHPYNQSRDQSAWYEHYTPECVERVLEVFDRDFENYGYSRDFEAAKSGKLFA